MAGGTFTGTYSSFEVTVRLEDLPNRLFSLANAGGENIRIRQEGGGQQLHRDITWFDSDNQQGRMTFLLPNPPGILDAVVEVWIEQDGTEPGVGAPGYAPDTWENCIDVRDFCGGSPTDRTLTNPDLTLVGSPTFSDDGITFNGSNQYAYATLAAQQITSFTLVVFASEPSLSGHLRIYGLTNWDVNASRALLGTNAGRIVQTNHNDGTTNAAASTGTGVTANVGFVAAGTFSESGTRAFLNQTSSAFASASLNFANAGWDTIVYGAWARASGAASHWAGSLRLARMYSDILSVGYLDDLQQNIRGPLGFYSVEEVNPTLPILANAAVTNVGATDARPQVDVVHAT